MLTFGPNSPHSLINATSCGWVLVPYLTTSAAFALAGDQLVVTEKFASASVGPPTRPSDVTQWSAVRTQKLLTSVPLQLLPLWVTVISPKDCCVAGLTASPAMIGSWTVPCGPSGDSLPVAKASYRPNPRRIMRPKGIAVIKCRQCRGVIRSLR